MAKLKLKLVGKKKKGELNLPTEYFDLVEAQDKAEQKDKIWHVTVVINGVRRCRKIRVRAQNQLGAFEWAQEYAGVKSHLIDDYLFSIEKPNGKVVPYIER